MSALNFKPKPLQLSAKASLLLWAIILPLHAPAEDVPGHDGWSVVQTEGEGRQSYFLVGPKGEQAAVSESTAKRLTAGNANPVAILKASQAESTAATAKNGDAPPAIETKAESGEDTYVYSTKNNGYVSKGSYEKNNQIEQAAKLDSTAPKEALPSDVANGGKAREGDVPYVRGQTKWVTDSNDQEAANPRPQKNATAMDK